MGFLAEPKSSGKRSLADKALEKKEKLARKKERLVRLCTVLLI